MDREPTYGVSFVKHLTKLGRQTPYRYEDLQLVKVMSQSELADWIKAECREFSQLVRDNPAEVAAAIVHEKRSAMTQRSGAVAEVAVSFFQLLQHLF
jgi:hypothetical protein